MSLEIWTIIGVGIAIAGSILASNHRLRRDLSGGLPSSVQATSEPTLNEWGARLPRPMGCPGGHCRLPDGNAHKAAKLETSPAGGPLPLQTDPLAGGGNGCGRLL